MFHKEQAMCLSTHVTQFRNLKPINRLEYYLFLSANDISLSKSEPLLLICFVLSVNLLEKADEMGKKLVKLNFQGDLGWPKSKDTCLNCDKDEVKYDGDVWGDLRNI